jgi:hypothetical protein
VQKTGECIPSNLAFMTPKAKKWRNRTKEDYAAIFEAVRRVVHQIDPYGLLAQGFHRTSLIRKSRSLSGR